MGGKVIFRVVDVYLYACVIVEGMDCRNRMLFCIVGEVTHREVTDIWKHGSMEAWKHMFGWNFLRVCGKVA